MMRLTVDEVNILKKSIIAIDSKALLYLFGSRVDDTKRGGDIDILIVSSILDRHDLRKIRWQFFEYFGEQKIDLIVDDGKTNQAFIAMIKPRAVRL